MSRIADFHKLNPRLMAEREQAKLANRANVSHWQRENPEKSRAKGARYHQRKIDAYPNDFTAADWARVQEAFDHRCAYCGVGGELQREHIVPLTRGGSHTIANVVPACKLCNIEKGAHTPAEWGRMMWRLPVVKWRLY